MLILDCVFIHLPLISPITFKLEPLLPVTEPLGSHPRPPALVSLLNLVVGYLFCISPPSSTSCIHLSLLYCSLGYKYALLEPSPLHPPSSFPLDYFLSR